MATLTHLHLLRSPFFLSSEFRHRRVPNTTPSFVTPLSLPSGIRVVSSNSSKRRYRNWPFCCSCKANSQLQKVQVMEEVERPSFDINLAVILAGFAFEAYTSPPENVGRREVDAAGCITVYLSESFVREIYDGQLFIKLKKGYNFPAMDPWGTSDPYVIMEFDGQVVKSKIKWGTREPSWNEDFTIYIKPPPCTLLQVAAWDANLFTPHKRMGNAGVNLDDLCDGDLHELLVELEGMGGGGKITLEVEYKSFEEIDEDKKWWRIPFVSEFLNKKSFDSAIKMLAGSESVPAGQFVQYAFSQLKSLNETYLQKDWLRNIVKHENKNDEESNESSREVDTAASLDDYSEGCSSDPGFNDGSNAWEFSSSDTGDATQSSKHFWKNFADAINENVVQRLGISVPDRMKWDGFDMIKKIGIQSQQEAEAGYIESGLATPKSQEPDGNKNEEAKTLNIGKIQASLPDIKKATEDILRQTDSIFSALMVLAAAVPQLKSDSQNEKHNENKEDSLRKEDDHALKSDGLSVLDDRRAEEMRALFSTAESAMEAWAMLATSLGQPSLIKSEFEKICFLDNPSTDTQVAVWRDSTRKRLVVAFRGTEQAKWKDLLTDLMLVPAGLNPERIGGDFKEEVQVHYGFLSAYDSVRPRLMSVIKKAIGFIGDTSGPQFKWHVYCTGHSLGGALATLLALELSSSQLAKIGALSVTMYNFGSPRVGNRRFAEVTMSESEKRSESGRFWPLLQLQPKVKDSWRVVNHRDIIPTVPRLMGYCHVAQPVYLAAGDHKSVQENAELFGDGYEGDVIGEATPDVLVNEFMKGEKELIDRILQTEINIFRALRDGSALMQHMEDFYYISLLENVRRNYRTASFPVSGQEGSSIG